MQGRGLPAVVTTNLTQSRSAQRGLKCTPDDSRQFRSDSQLSVVACLVAPRSIGATLQRLCPLKPISQCQRGFGAQGRQTDALLLSFRELADAPIRDLFQATPGNGFIDMLIEHRTARVPKCDRYQMRSPEVSTTVSSGTGSSRCTHMSYVTSGTTASEVSVV